MNLYECPECGYVGIEGVTGGVGPWPGDGKVRCPSRRCEYRTVMNVSGSLVPREVADRLRREIHRTNHRAIVPFEDCRMCADDVERLKLGTP